MTALAVFSLNPIENEAVVAEVLRQVSGWGATYKYSVQDPRRLAKHGLAGLHPTVGLARCLLAMHAFTLKIRISFRRLCYSL